MPSGLAKLPGSRGYGKIRIERDGEDMAEQRLDRLEIKLDGLDKRIGKIGYFTRILDGRLINLRADVTEVKSDIRWLKWIMGVSGGIIAGALIYLANRQNVMQDTINAQLLNMQETLSGQMINLLQQLVDK